jgi:hypothetical protein
MAAPVNRYEALWTSVTSPRAYGLEIPNEKIGGYRSNPSSLDTRQDFVLSFVIFEKDIRTPHGTPSFQ